MKSELNGIDGVKSIAFDIFIFDKDHASHDKVLEEVLQGLRERDLTLNKDKCAFNKSHLDFLALCFRNRECQLTQRRWKLFAQLPYLRTFQN